MLAFLAEEGMDSASDDWIDELIEDMLVSKQARRRKYDIRPLRDIFRATSSSVVDSVTDPELRKVFASTGLTIRSCQKLKNFIDENHDRMMRLMTTAGAEDREVFAETVLRPVCRLTK